ncbi:unnamed protein product [Candidula unifasciata]|uniref:Glucose-methanol-choline oxidoreductase N-terminal domain-containing protein n=1 Tax=Candidula unifasciata TaxID=100452 RepID=A0A8S3Z5Y4_9EUPU|nr:unnamed protein product [Candidula unifasciata]
MSLTVNIALVVLSAIVLRYFYFTDSSKSPRLVEKLNSTYDYVIVGGGSAGCVVASRLSEDKDVSVLLLEAGEFDNENPHIIIPALGVLNFKSNIDWSYETEPQDGVLTGLHGKRSYWPRGKVLGGSSSINVMQYVRASRHDYDRWAEYTKDEGWSYQHVLPYFKKSEDIRIPELQNSPYHGHGGPLPISHSKTVALGDTLIKAGQAVGIPFNEDYNGRTMEGEEVNCSQKLVQRQGATHRLSVLIVLQSDTLKCQILFLPFPSSVASSLLTLRSPSF